MLTAIAIVGVGSVVGMAVLVVRRCVQESEHDPWLEACDDCGAVCPTPFGPLIVAWFDKHECEAGA